METKEFIVQITPSVSESGTITLALTNLGRVFMSEQIYKYREPNWIEVSLPEELP